MKTLRLCSLWILLIHVLGAPARLAAAALEHDPNAAAPALHAPMTVSPRSPNIRPIVLPSLQAASTVLMVRPVDFGYNPETSVDNVFEHHGDDPAVVSGRAMREFDHMVQTLRAAGVTVLVLEGRGGKIRTPDAVFPNNWLSVDHYGAVLVYPMKTPDRRAETGRIGAVMKLLHRSDYVIAEQPTYIGNGSQQALEGTGAMVIDHDERIIYAALSQRCDARLLDTYARARNYAPPVAFHTRGSGGKPFYHTNVMMSIGHGFAVISSAAIPNRKERQRVLNDLRRSHEVIDISLQQAETHFCANLLQVTNHEGAPIIVMSKNAYDGFTADQRARLAKYGKLVAADINTIESVGGGSARCMMAEIFASKSGSGDLVQ